MGKFVVRNGELEGRKFRLEPGAKVALGRELGDLNFPDKRMSRRHCIIESREDGDILQDLGSTNGTWVNNQRVTEARLAPGDLIRVGFTELEFLGEPVPHAHAAGIGVGEPTASASQTIAFRPIRDGREAAPAAEAVHPQERRGRDKGRLRAAKHAAMGKSQPGSMLISAKGKFCEACGEAIFMKEGAPDEGVVTDGLYLCRMCALIAEKQKDVGGDFLPSYAKIVGGRMIEKPDPHHLTPPPPPPPTAVELPSEAPQIIESEEVSLDDLTGPGTEAAPAAGHADVPGAPADAPAPAPQASADEPELVSEADLLPPDGSATLVDGRDGAAGAARPQGAADPAAARVAPPVRGMAGPTAVVPVPPRGEAHAAAAGEAPAADDEDGIPTPPKGVPVVSEASTEPGGGGNVGTGDRGSGTEGQGREGTTSQGS